MAIIFYGKGNYAKKLTELGRVFSRWICATVVGWAGKFRGETLRDGMKNAYNQGESEEERWAGWLAQKKIPCWVWVSASPRGKAGKKFPYQVVCETVILLTGRLYFCEANTAEGEDMQRIMAGLLLISCCGCSGGIHSNLVEIDMRLASPMFGEDQRVPVVYPGRNGVSDDPMVQAFGPSWRSMEKDYPAYNFNP